MIALLAIACAPADGPSPGPDRGSPAARDGALDGRVIDADGQPVSGATVTTDPRGYEATTGPDGGFTVERLLPGAYVAVVAADGFTPAVSDPVTVVANEAASIEVTLTDAAATPVTLEVEVLGPDGAPLAGATVDAGAASGLTDALGVARLEPGPGLVDVAVGYEGTWPRTVPGVSIPASGGVQLALTLSGRPPEGSVVAGNGLCALCHADHAAETRHARAADLTAPEADRAFTGGWSVDVGSGAAARFAAGRTVVLVDRDGGERAYAVAGWIGDPSRAAVPWAELGADPVPLPVVWVADDADRLPLGEAAAHLAPFEPERWFDAGLPREPLPAESASARCLPCHVTGAAATIRADGGVDLATTWPTGVPGRFAEAGVGCEACHGPGSAHVAAAIPDKLWTITRPDRLDPDQRADLCASCHAAFETADGLPWIAGFAAGDRLADAGVASVATFWTSGAADQPGEQADELAAGLHGDGSSWPLGCTDCHDPHGTGPEAPMLRVSADDDTLCAGCHLDASFGGDELVLAEHSGHDRFDPAAPTGSGRCAGCHMPRTASRAGFGSDTGAGRLASHAFVATPPSDAVAVFDALGVETLAPGAFPADPCQDCHAVALAVGGPLETGPSGDPSLRETHADLQTSFDRMFP